MDGCVGWRCMHGYEGVRMGWRCMHGMKMYEWDEGVYMGWSCTQHMRTLSDLTLTAWCREILAYNYFIIRFFMDHCRTCKWLWIISQHNLLVLELVEWRTAESLFDSILTSRTETNLGLTEIATLYHEWPGMVETHALYRNMGEKSLLRWSLRLDRWTATTIQKMHQNEKN